MPKVKELPKVVCCQYCKEKVHEGDECFRMALGQALATRALNRHLAVCTKAPSAAKGSAISKTGVKGVSIKKCQQILNCPFCLKEQQANNVRRHIHSKHKFQAVLASPLWARTLALKHKIPIAICQNKFGDTELTFCLHCSKGHLDTCRKSRTTRIDLLAKSGEHNDCIKHFETYRKLFEMEEFEPIPFSTYWDKNAEESDHEPPPEPTTYETPKLIVGNEEIVKAFEILRERFEPDDSDNDSTNEENDPVRKVFTEMDIVNHILKEHKELLEDAKKYRKDLWTLERPIQKIIGDTTGNLPYEELAEELKNHINMIERRHQSEINRLKKQLEEKDGVIETFGTIKFTGSKASKVNSDSDSDWD